MKPADASVHVGIPEDARRLIWDVFFVQASRGVAFDAHLPWSDAPDTRTVVLRLSGDAIAAAVIRPAPQAGVAMIGFVCVDVRARGQGHARHLIAFANEVIDAAGYRAALLWTGKPAVYAEHGYAVIGRDVFLHVFRTAALPACRVPVTAVAWPAPNRMAGLPAFASSGSHYRSTNAEAVIVYGPKSATLLDWRGDLDDVVTLLAGADIDHWSVNVPSADPFVQALDPNQFAMTLREGASTMARRADNAAALDYVPVIDRI